MSLTAADLDLCNRAIDKVSGDRIADFGEESPLAVFCADNWPAKRRMLLGKYRWTVCNKVRLLSALEIAPTETAVMTHKFARPADLVGVVHDFRDHPDPRAASRPRPVVLLESGVYWSDQARLFAEYTCDLAVEDWPSWLEELALFAFAADLAAHCQLTTLRREYESKAWGTPGMDGEGGLYQTARNEDARQAPQRELQTGGVDAGPLIGARYAGSGLPWGIGGGFC